MVLDIEKVKKKIRALLARNTENGATLAEAEACLEKATQLLDEFNLDIKELLEDTDPNTQKVIEEYIYENGNITPELWELQCQVAWLFNCEAIKSRRPVKGYRYRKVFVRIVGNPYNVEKVKFFLQLFEDTIQNCIKQENISGLRNINSFKRGFYLALASKAEDLRYNQKDKEEKKQLEAKTGTSLIVLDRKNVDDYIKLEIPNLKTRTNNFNNYGKQTERNNFNKGQEYGNMMSFNDEITENKKLLRG